MSQSQIELNEHIHDLAQIYRRLLPEASQAGDTMAQSVYKSDKIDAKTKRLMAMTAALVSGCRACILYQCREALDLGASVEEIIECMGVALSLGGTMAFGESTRLVDLLMELGLIAEGDLPPLAV